LDGGGGVVADTVLAGFLDRVVVVAGALDHAGVAALAARVNVLRVRDPSHDAGEDALVRGEKPGLRLGGG
jgi:hypothetical protein